MVRTGGSSRPPGTREMRRWLGASLPPEVSIEVEVAEGTPPVLADGTQFRRVLTNLLLNARHAVGSAGRIAIQARGEPGNPTYPLPPGARGWYVILY